MAREILFEFQRIGASLRVSALDAETGLEVSFVAPAGAGEAALRQLAVRKLDYVRRRREEEASKPR